MKELLFKLCRYFGPSGDENKICEVVAVELSKYAEVNIDKNLNVIAVMGNLSAEKNILLDAHIDQIGMVVTDIDEDGFLRIAPCGGVDRRVLPGSMVKIYGKKIVDGIVCSTPPHLLRKEEDDFLPVDKLIIDTGLDGGEVKDKVRLGDRVEYLNQPRELLNNKISACAIDNRAGVAALIETAKLLSTAKLNCKLTILLSAKEETGAVGAKTGTYSICPDEAISVDVTFGNQPGVSPVKSGQLSKGPLIGISPILSNQVTEKIKNIATENNIAYQIEVMGGTTGTNADSIAASKAGVPTGLISIPIRYMHTPVEVVDISDIEHTAKILSEYVKKEGL